MRHPCLRLSSLWRPASVFMLPTVYHSFIVRMYPFADRMQSRNVRNGFLLYATRGWSHHFGRVIPESILYLPLVPS